MGERLASLDVPQGLIRFRADAEPWLRDLGYVPYGHVVDADDRDVFHKGAWRENATLEPGPRGPQVFEKRARTLTLTQVRKASSRAGHLTSPHLHEWDMLWKARDAGLRVPEPVAAGMSKGVLFPKSDFLITERLEGTALLHMLDYASLRPSCDQKRLAADVGRGVARFHAAGIAFPDLFAKHVYVKRGEGGGWDVGFLDLANAYLRPDLPPSERARDLGALAGSLPFKVAPRMLVAFLRAYLGDDRAWRLEDCWADVARAADEHLRLRRFRRGLSVRTDSPTTRIQIHGKPPDHEQKAMLALLDRFEIPVLPDGQAVSIRDDVAAPLKRLLIATVRAGVLPVGNVLPHVHATEAGALAWDPLAPLRAPRRARALHAHWRLFFLRREIARSPLSPDVKRSVLQDLGGDLAAAFALQR